MAGIDPRVAKLAQKLNSLEREIRALKTPQLANSSIVDGALKAYDDELGLETVLIGRQYDGTNTVAPVVGPTPPTPTAPVLASGLGGATIEWDGLFADGSVAPMDFARVDAHISTSPLVTSNDPTVGSFVSARGGTFFVGLDAGTYWISLVTWAQTGKPSDPSAAVSVVVTEPNLEGSDGLPPPDMTDAPTVVGGKGSLMVMHPGVVNPDGRPVKYAVHAEPITESATDFVADSSNKIGYMDSTFAVFEADANGVPLTLGEGFTQTLEIDEFDILAAGEVSVTVVDGFDRVPELGNVVTLTGTGFPDIDGSWPVTGVTDSSTFVVQTLHTETPASGVDVADDTAALTIPSEQRYGVKIWPEDEDGPAVNPTPMGAGVIQRIGGVDIDANSITVDQIMVNQALVGSIMAAAVEGSLIRSGSEGARWEGDFRGIRLYGPDGSLVINLPTFSEDPDDPLLATFAGQGWFNSLGVANYASFDGRDNSFNKGSIFRLLSGTTRPSSAPIATTGWEELRARGDSGTVGITAGVTSDTIFDATNYGAVAGLTRQVWSPTSGEYVWNGSVSLPSTYGPYGSPVVNSTTGKIFQTVVSTTAMTPYKKYLHFRRINAATMTQEASVVFQPGGPGSPYGANGKYGSTLVYDHHEEAVWYCGVNSSGHVNMFEVNQATLAAPAPSDHLRLPSASYGSPGAFWSPSDNIVGGAILGDGVNALEQAAPRMSTSYTKAPLGGGTVTVTTTAPHGFVSGMSIAAKTGPFSDGSIYFVESVTPTTFTFAATTGTVGTFPMVADFRPTKMLFTLRESVGSGVDAWAWSQPLGDWIYSAQDGFPISGERKGFCWSPYAGPSGAGGFVTRRGDLLAQHTDIMNGSESSTWWVTHTLYDANGTGGTHETEMAAPRQFTVPDRVAVFIQPPPMVARPIPNTSDDPTHNKIFVSRNQFGSPPHVPSRTEFELLTTTDGFGATPGTVIRTMPAFPASPSSTPPVSNNFPAASPAEFRSTKTVPTLSAGAPVNPLIDAPALLKGDGDSWLAPPGEIRLLSGTQNDGWLLLNGQTLSQAAYPLLFEKFGLDFWVGTPVAGEFMLPTMVGTDAMWTPLPDLTKSTAPTFNLVGTGYEARIVDGRVCLNGFVTPSSGLGANTTYNMTGGALPARFRPGKTMTIGPGSSGSSGPYYQFVQYLPDGLFNFRTGVTAGTNSIFVDGLSYPLKAWVECDFNYFVRAM